MSQYKTISHDNNTELLRFTTAGSVDDGKSTLIGRLLYDSKSIFQDQFDAIEEVSKRYGNDALVGAGTVLDPEIATACISVGAQFVVSPALNLATIACCQDHHHRRRLSLFLHAETQVYHCRYAGPYPVYA